jgi:hypothetical protein
MRKWVWKLIKKIAELGPVVVSAIATHFCLYPFSISHQIIILSLIRLILKAGKIAAAGMTA